MAKPATRHRARALAVQAIYQWQITGDTVANIRLQFNSRLNTNKVDVEYFNSLIGGIIEQVSPIDKLFIPFLDRNLKELDQVELAVLRIATFELANYPEIPYKVIINEALELAKTYGSKDGYKYVNGILDKLAQQYRVKK